MEWSAQSFIERVLKPQAPGQPWWANLAGEVRQKRPPGRYLVDTLAAELADDIPDYRRHERRLFFFSSHAQTAIDGRAGVVGVEEKCADLTFRCLIDGAIHRGIVWVLGDPQSIATPEAVSLHVVKPGAPPITDPSLSGALWCVLGWLAALHIHIIYVNGETGQAWRSQEGIPMPTWLATEPGPEAGPSMQSAQRLTDQLDSIDIEAGVHRYPFDASLECYEFQGIAGANLAYAEWPHNHWQIIEIGLLLRGAGYDAVKVVYTGDTRLLPAGRAVEGRTQALLKKRFGVVLDWGVPV